MSVTIPAPTKGRVLRYTLSRYDVQTIIARRNKSRGLFAGATPTIGEVVPLWVTLAGKMGDPMHAYRVHGQAVLTGNDTLWVSAAEEGTGEGQWHWPEIVK